MTRAVPEPPSHEITPESVYMHRREFIKNGARALGVATTVGGLVTWLVHGAPAPDAPEPPTIAALSGSAPTPPIPTTDTTTVAPVARDAASPTATQMAVNAEPNPESAEGEAATKTETTATPPSAPSTSVARTPTPEAPTYSVPDEPQTPLRSVTTYNNFYEFGEGKDDPAR